MNGATPAFVAVANELLALDDAQDLPKLGVTFLAKRTDLSYSTTRGVLARLTRVGHLLSDSSAEPD
jgi:DNA-binding IclR family transcriptional regulator